MPFYSHGANFQSSTEIRVVPNATVDAYSYIANMARKRNKSPIQAPGHDWYLRQWMRTLKVSQTKLAGECGWNTSTMHGIYHGRTAYYRDILNLIADKLNIEPYELLMHPEQAMAYRQFRREALRVVEATQPLEETGT